MMELAVLRVPSSFVLLPLFCSLCTITIQRGGATTATTEAGAGGAAAAESSAYITNFTIGAVLSDERHDIIFRELINVTNFFTIILIFSSS